MDDKQFLKLQLRTIAPSQDKWPTDFDHWKALHVAADLARKTVADAWARLDAIDSNRDLTTEAKAKRRAQVAAEAMDALDDCPALHKAREKAGTMITKWEKVIGETIKVPTDDREIVLHQEIRNYVRNELSGSKVDWINTHADQTALAALLSVPGFLTGLSEAELTAARLKAESFADPQIVAARNETKTALREVERGFQAARAKIAKSVGTSAAISAAA